MTRPMHADSGRTLGSVSASCSGFFAPSTTPYRGPARLALAGLRVPR